MLVYILFRKETKLRIDKLSKKWIWFSFDWFFAYREIQLFKRLHNLDNYCLFKAIKITICDFQISYNWPTFYPKYILYKNCELKMFSNMRLTKKQQMYVLFCVLHNISKLYRYTYIFIQFKKLSSIFHQNAICFN